MPTYRRIDHEELTRFAVEVFQAAGASPAIAAEVADNLVQGELHGLGGHGLSRLLPIYTRRMRAGGINVAPNIKTVSCSGTTAVVDGDGGPGSVVGNYAMSLAIDMAREHGSGWVAARNSTHYGAAFLFARKALPLGMIGFSTTNAVPNQAPFGGRDSVLGTNPLCIAVPGGARGPIILDMATTVVARGKVQIAALEGKPIPLGWAVDGQNRPTTDPNAVAAGRLLPLGGYKGYGLALMVEVFSSVISGAMIGPQIGGLFSGIDKKPGNGHFFGALDVSRFMPVDEFCARMDYLVETVKGVALDDGAEEVLVPGEPEARCYAAYFVEGVPIAEEIIEGLNAVGADLGVAPLRLRV
ncbi:MAG: Ldh family oxidoreductase [Anaerolineae bacterium]